ncbi:uncharacterized protein LOC144163712 [Haemaphysalis longicornis]
MTYTLLGNISNAAAPGLLGHLNKAYESSRSPAEWKEAELNELVIKRATKNAPRRILVLDLKGAFDNVSYASVLENLRKTGCGRKIFSYLKDFLTKRTATVRIGEERLEPVEQGDSDTPQGSVLLPLLFNLPLLPLPELLKQVEGVDHALYSDDITVWTSRVGSDAWGEEVLQRAATTVHEYAKTCGLSCATQKSELLMLQPGRPKKEAPPNVTISTDGTQMKPTEQICILDLLLRCDGRAMAALTKIKNTSEQVTSMLRRVANRYRGLKEEDALRLVPAFVVGRVIYSASYLRLTKADKEAFNATIRKAKTTMGMPTYSSTQRLMYMGTLNTAES